MSARRRLAGVPPAHPEKISRGGTYAEYIPWKIARRHETDPILRCLRLNARAATGGELTSSEQRELASFQAFCDTGVPDGPVVVTYDRNDVDGFWFVPAKAGDVNYIRRPAAA